MKNIFFLLMLCCTLSVTAQIKVSSFTNLATPTNDLELQDIQHKTRIKATNLVGLYAANVTVTQVALPPLATGNLTNKNSFVKDNNSDVWFIDYAGKAVKTGSAVTNYTFGTGLVVVGTNVSAADNSNTNELARIWNYRDTLNHAPPSNPKVGDVYIVRSNQFGMAQGNKYALVSRIYTGIINGSGQDGWQNLSNEFTPFVYGVGPNLTAGNGISAGDLVFKTDTKKWFYYDTPSNTWVDVSAANATAPVNFANSDLTQTGTRIYNGGNNALTMTALEQFIVQGNTMDFNFADAVKIQSDGGSVDIIAPQNNINLASSSITLNSITTVGINGAEGSLLFEDDLLMRSDNVRLSATDLSVTVGVVKDGAVLNKWYPVIKTNQFGSLTAKQKYPVLKKPPNSAGNDGEITYDAIKLNDLDSVLITNPQVGDVLQRNSQGYWTNTPISNVTGKVVAKYSRIGMQPFSTSTGVSYCKYNTTLVAPTPSSSIVLDPTTGDLLINKTGKYKVDVIEYVAGAQAYPNILRSLSIFKNAATMATTVSNYTPSFGVGTIVSVTAGDVLRVELGYSTLNAAMGDSSGNFSQITIIEL